MPILLKKLYLLQLYCVLRLRKTLNIEKRLLEVQKSFSELQILSDGIRTVFCFCGFFRDLNHGFSLNQHFGIGVVSVLYFQYFLFFFHNWSKVRNYRSIHFSLVSFLWVDRKTQFLLSLPRFEDRQYFQTEFFLRNLVWFALVFVDDRIVPVFDHMLGSRTIEEFRDVWPFFTKIEDCSEEQNILIDRPFVFFDVWV